MTDLTLPANLDCERAILGAILLDNSTYDQAAAKLSTEDFSLDSHRRIFLRMEELAEDGRPIDFVTLTEQLGKHKEIESVGGVAYVTSLTDGLPRVKNIETYVRIVEDKAMLRSMINACNGTVNACYEQEDTARRIYSIHDEHLLQIIGQTSDTNAVTVAAFSDDVFTEIANLRAQGDKLAGFSYGVDELNFKTHGGIRKKEFTIIGGRPKQGKTALGLQTLQANCDEQIPAGFFSVEMNKEAILERLWSSVGKIPFNHIREPNLLTDEELVRLYNAKERVDSWPLYIDDSAEVTINEICARARLLKKRHNVELVVVDYMQIINGTGDIRQRLIKISRALRTLAKTQGMAVIGLSQLARPSDKNINRRPEIWDLKESGSLEADANTILLIFRPVKEDGEQSGEDEILITQRSGQPGMAIVTYLGNYMRFESRYLRGL